MYRKIKCKLVQTVLYNNRVHHSNLKLLNSFATTQKLSLIVCHSKLVEVLRYILITDGRFSSYYR